MFGWQDKGQQLLEITREGRWQDMAKVMTDDMLETFVPRGTYETIAGEYKRRYAGLSRRVTFPMPSDPANDALAARVIAELKT